MAIFPAVRPAAAAPEIWGPRASTERRRGPAIKSYTAGIAVCETDEALYSNRAGRSLALDVIII